MVLATPRFIGFLRPNQDNGVVVAGWFTIYEALCSAGFFAADDANCVEFRDIFRNA